jgi:gas vesicle protein
MNKPGSNTKTFLFGLLIGAVAGAIAGILLAPDKGSETRKRFMNKADEFSDNLPERIEAIKAAIEQKLNEIKASINQDKTDNK